MIKYFFTAFRWPSELSSVTFCCQERLQLSFKLQQLLVTPLSPFLRETVWITSCSLRYTVSSASFRSSVPVLYTGVQVLNPLSCNLTTLSTRPPWTRTQLSGLLLLVHVSLLTSFLTHDLYLTIALNNSMSESSGCIGDISVQLLWRESMKQLSATPLNSFKQGSACIEVLLVKKVVNS